MNRLTLLWNSTLIEMSTKNLTMDDINLIFGKMLKEQHKTAAVQKYQEMFHKQEQSILDLITENNWSTNQRLDNLSKDVNDLKENREFSPNEYEDKFENLGNKVEKLEKIVNLIKQELRAIQTIKSSWPIEAYIELFDLEDCSRQNSLRFEEIKEHEN